LAVAESIMQQVEAHQWDQGKHSRQGSLAMPHTVLEPIDAWSVEDTVVLRRKAG
jgi:hypothetical protein